jgi:hypothetical protein
MKDVIILSAGIYGSIYLFKTALICFNENPNYLNGSILSISGVIVTAILWKSIKGF